jgi:hypothetical protein
MRTVKAVLILLTACALANPALAHASKTDQRHIEKIRKKVEGAFERGNSDFVYIVVF